MIPAEARSAWHELEARLRPYIGRRVASRADVDDVLQEVFTRIHCGIDQLLNDDRFGAWVYRIAQRAISDHMRIMARSALPVSAPLDASAEPSVDEAGLVPAIAKECVPQFVARLPAGYREAITLTEFDGLTQKQAAEQLGLSISGVKSRVQRGRAKIRSMFEDCCEISLDCRGRVVRCDARPIHEVPEDCRAAAAAWAREHGTCGEQGSRWCGEPE